jgi:hypothetical protein
MRQSILSEKAVLPSIAAMWPVRANAERPHIHDRNRSELRNRDG